MEQLNKLQTKLDQINDRTIRLENRLDYFAIILDRMSTQITDLTERNSE